MGGHEVVFASKAFPCTAVLRVFEREGLSVDVASGGELALARRAGFTGRRILFHGNAKSEAELRAAADAGARIVVDNFDELDRLARIAAPADVLVRVTPGVVADTHAAILTGHAGSKFGFPLADAPEAIERLRAAPWADLRGLHIHIGSQLFDLAPWRAAVQAIADPRRLRRLRPRRRARRGLRPRAAPAHGRPSTSSAMIATAEEVLGARQAALARAGPRAHRRTRA